MTFSRSKKINPGTGVVGPRPVLFPYAMKQITLPSLSPLPSSTLTPASPGGMKQSQGHVGLLEAYFGMVQADYFSESRENVPSGFGEEVEYDR